MKIVHICSSYIDGYSYQDNVLPRIQSSLGHDVVVLTPIIISYPHYKMTEEDYNKPNLYTIDGVKIKRLKSKYNFIGSRFAIIKGLYKEIEYEEPDLLYCHVIQSFNVLSACRYKKANPDCCVITDAHTDIYNSGSNIISRVVLHRLLWRFIAKKAEKQLDNIYYITPNVKYFLLSMYGLSEKKLAPTYLGGDVSMINNINTSNIRRVIRGEFGIKDSEYLIVTAGKIDESKKTHLLLEAIKILNNKNLHVVIVGSIDEKYQIKLNAYNNGNSNIHFTGWVSSDKVLEYFISADLGVFPRSQSVLWQDAICCGLPCIFGYYPGGEYLNPGGNAVYFYSDNPNELSQIINTLICCPLYLNKMREAAQTIGVDRFNYVNISNKITEFSRK